MKNIIGRTGIMGALIMGAMAINGCSAESGEQSAIGETSEALGTGTIPASGTIAALTVSSVNKFHQYGSSCEISDSGHTYWLVTGGQDGTPTLNDKIHLIKDDGTVMSSFEQAYGGTIAARRYLTVFKKPGVTNACYSVGGENGGTSKAEILKFVLSHSGSTPSIAVTNPTNLTTARAAIEVLPYQGKFILTNGYKAASNPSDVLEVFDPSNDTVATLKNKSGSAVTLNTARYGSAAAIDAANGVLVIAGGNDGNGQLANAEVLPLTTSVQLDDTSATHPVLVSNVLQNGDSMSPATEAREGLVAFHDGNRFVFATGAAAGGDKATQDAVTFTIGRSPATASVNVKATSTPTNLVAVSYASFALKPGASFSKAFLVGGGSPYAGVGSANANVQEYNVTGTAYTSWATRDNTTALPNMSGAVTTYMSGASFLAFGLHGTAVNSSAANTSEVLNR